MSAPNDPHDSTNPTQSRAPVRPAILGQPLPMVEEPSAPRPPATTRTRRAVGDAPHPCPGCGYDLRGLPAGGRCPECATKIPRRVRVIPSSPESRELRFEVAAAWSGLSVVALAPILLLTPLPYILPFGMPLAVAVGFAPCFRLVALRKFDRLPEAFAQIVAAPVRRLRALQIAELGFVAIVLVFAVGGTAGAIPGSLVWMYDATLLAWWLVAMATVSAQLRGGHAIAAQMVDPTILPSVDRPVRSALLARIVGGAGVVVGVAATTLAAGTALAAPAALVGLLLLLTAAGLGVHACLLAYGHAPIVAECMIESELLREGPAPDAGEGETDPLDPPPPSSPPGTWEDEERVPLA